MSEEGNFSGLEPRLGGGVYDWHFLFEDMLSGRERQGASVESDRARQIRQEAERREALGVGEILERLVGAINDPYNRQAEGIREALRSRQLEIGDGVYMSEEERLVCVRSRVSGTADNLVLGVGISEDSDVRFAMSTIPFGSGCFFNKGFGTCTSREDVVWALKTFITSVDTTTVLGRERYTQRWDDRFIDAMLVRRWPRELDPLVLEERFTLMGREMNIPRGDSRWWRAIENKNRRWIVPVTSGDFNGLLLKVFQENLYVSNDVRTASCSYNPVDEVSLISALGAIGKHFIVTQVEPIYFSESNVVYSYLVLVEPKK